MKYVGILVSAVWIISLLGGVACRKYGLNDGTVMIAVAGPKNTERGKSLLNGARLYVDSVNQRGGVNGKKIILKFFNDKGDNGEAKKQAEEIVTSRAVAVIGHVSSKTSLAGGDVYQKFKIPAITPSATNDKITEFRGPNDNWYFRTIFNNDLQAKFLAYFIKNVLNRNAVYIIREDADHSSGIAESFIAVAKQLGFGIVEDWEFNIDDENLSMRFDRIITELRARPDGGTIFIGAHVKHGAELVKRIKDAGIKNEIIGPTAFATQAFLEEFCKFSKTETERDYYTDGLYVGVPLIFDTANNLAQDFKSNYLAAYDKKPDWQAAYYYDTAMVLVKAIGETNISLDGDNPAGVTDARKKIRDYLASLTRNNGAVTGTTGLNYFDEDRNCSKPMAIGVYRSGDIISAQAQLKLVPDSARKTGPDGRISQAGDLTYKGNYISKTDVVYVGLEVNSISEVDEENAACLIDFYIWFRYQGKLAVQDVVFLNAVDPIRLGQLKAPGKKEQRPDSGNRAVYVKNEPVDGGNLRLYHVKAKFRHLFSRGPQTIEAARLLGFKFRHRTLNRNDLIYVTDILGMGLTGKKTYFENLNKKPIFAATPGWDIDNVSLFQDRTRLTGEHDWSVNTPGLLDASAGMDSRNFLRHFDIQNTFAEASRFNFEVMISENTNSLRRKFPGEDAKYVSVICLILLLSFALAGSNKSFHRYSGSIWFLQIFLVVFLMFAGEVVLLEQMADLDVRYLKWTIRFFDILWWLVPALFLHLTLQHFLWVAIETRTGFETPEVLRRLPSYIICFVAGYGIITFVFELNITRLMATSGAAAMVAGYLVKDNIANYFASISIVQGYEIKTGQWVKINGYDEGKVENITKLVTRIRTRNGGLLSIPNKVVLNSDIQNYGFPDDVYWLDFTLNSIPEAPPEKVIGILTNALLSTEGVLKTPEPIIIFEGQGDSSAIYTVRFAVKDYGCKNEHLTAAWKSAWEHLKEAGIELATPQRIIHISDGGAEA